MDTKFNPGTEVVVTAPDRQGILAEISHAIDAANIRIKAICAYEVDDMAHMRLVTDDDKRAIAALNAAGFKATGHEILMCEIAPHELHPANIAGGMEVENNYWCASAHSGEHALLIFSPKENLKAASLK